MASRVSIISRTALRRVSSNSGSLFESFVITSFQLSKAVHVIGPTWKSSGSSTKSEEFMAFDKNSSNIETTSDGKDEYN